MAAINRLAMTFALAAGAALIPALAEAQDIQEIKGSFDLPVEAHWSQIDLAPGHYTLAVNRSLSGFQLVRLDGPTGANVKVVIGSTQVKQDKADYLRLQKSGDTYALREFHCGALGQAFRFKAPKGITETASGTAPHETLVQVVSARQ